MSGRICRVFPGESFESCLNATKEQLEGRYWESKRQEAKWQLALIKVLLAVKSTDAYKTITAELEEKAYPFDPEADGDFTGEDWPMLKSFFGDAAQAV